MTATVYDASGIADAPKAKKKHSTKAEMEAFRAAIRSIVKQHGPCSVRHVFYQAVVAGLVEKDVGTSRANEQRVGRALNHMRETGTMPFTWITDNTRTRFSVKSYRSGDAALAEWTRAYRRDLWQSQARHVEVWCESDSIAGVIDDLVRRVGAGPAAVPRSGPETVRVGLGAGVRRDRQAGHRVLLR